MTKSQTVATHLKSRLITGTIIIWGLVITAMVAIIIEYFSTRHSILLLAVGLLAGTCAISLVMLVFILPVLQCLDTLEVWVSESARKGVVQPIALAPFQKKSVEPILRSCNALSARLKVDSYQRVKFADRLAHDMRSSLASIQGYAEVLVDYHVGLEGASLQSYGKIIANQTNRLVKMIEDAQTATCISEGQLSLEFEPVKPCALLDALIGEARKKNVREIIYQDDLGDYLISGDSFRLREMMSKLIENALSFSTSYVSIHSLVEEDQAGRWVKISVEDHGNPLSETELNALYHPYDPPRDQKTSPIFHSSMSFYIIKAIVDSHNGKMSIQSQPGLGTTYIILLPVQKVNE